MARASTPGWMGVPVSAGGMFFGGSYMGATAIPGSGSLPHFHQIVNITAKETRGKKTIGLPAMNHQIRVRVDGCWRTPLGMKTSALNPSRADSGFMVAADTSAPFTSAIPFALEP